MKTDIHNLQTQKNWFVKWMRILGIAISIGTFFLLFSNMGIAAPPVPLPPHPPGLPRPPLPPVPPPVIVPPLPPGPPVIVHHPPGPPPHPGWVWVPDYYRGHRRVPGYWSRPKRYGPRYDRGPRYDHGRRYDRVHRRDPGPPPHPGPHPPVR
jgi:hypothetical protein